MKKKLHQSIPIFLLFGLCSNFSKAQSTVAVQPEAGFIVTTTNKAIYSVNAATGTSKLITTMPFLATTANALCNDSSRGILYFIENGGLATNTSIYGYNYKTNTHFTLIADFKTAPGSPLIVNGMGTSGATANDGFIYMGCEEARSLSPGVSSYNFGGETFFPFSNRIYKITLNTEGTAIINTEVFKDYYNDNNEISYKSVAGVSGNFDSDWGDFVIVNDTLFERINKTIPGGYEAYSNAYKMSSPAAKLYHTITPFAEKVNQTAEDGNKNLIYVGGLEGSPQQYVYPNKNNGTYNFPTAKNLTLNGVNLTTQVADATSAIKGEGSLGNTVWNDVNTNGIKDAGEQGIQNAPVELWEDLDFDGIINIVVDKLVGTAITDASGHYNFIKVLPGNYLVRTIMTTSVNYPAQGFSATYPSNQLANAGTTFLFSGDETTGVGSTFNLLTKGFSTVIFNDQTVDFAFTGTFSVLPISDISLNANYNNNFVTLNWSIASTSNEKYFAIEKSIDGIQFNAIENGVFNLNNLAYQKTTIDNNIIADVQYYRVKITDQSGVVKYSAIEKVIINNLKKDIILLYPNPTKNKATFLVPNSLITTGVQIQIVNGAGQVVKQIKATTGQNNIDVNLNGLHIGTYYWKAINKNNKIVSIGKLELL